MKNTKYVAFSSIAYAAAIIVLVMFVAVLSFGGWFVARKLNYSLSYKSMVEQTVKDMVKEECLKKK